MEQFRKSFAAVTLSGMRLANRKALLQTLLHELGLPFRRREEGELRLALIDHLNKAGGPAEGLLLLVDEAHTLPPKMFEELRLLSNITRQGRPRMRLVLAGAASLDQRLAHPKLAAFQQRVAVRCTLQSFRAAETHEYVRAQTAAAGGDADTIWTDDALSAVQRWTDGVPRLVNQLCDRALILAAESQLATIDGSSVDDAWADFQQLPTAGKSHVTIGSSERPTDEADDGLDEAVVEFSALDDADEDHDAPANHYAVEDAEVTDAVDERQPAVIELPAPQAARRPDQQSRQSADSLTGAQRITPAVESFISEEEHVVVSQFGCSKPSRVAMQRSADHRDFTSSTAGDDLDDDLAGSFEQGKLQIVPGIPDTDTEPVEPDWEEVPTTIAGIRPRQPQKPQHDPVLPDDGPIQAGNRRSFDEPRRESQRQKQQPTLVPDDAAPTMVVAWRSSNSRPFDTIPIVQRPDEAQPAGDSQRVAPAAGTSSNTQAAVAVQASPLFDQAAPRPRGPRQYGQLFRRLKQD
ncbi:MAG: AAA family ATPase [Planctomycetia bacterium]|nr:AAA family ATPase [Planctomycetia bacterium]